MVQNTDLISIHSTSSTMLKENDQATSRWQVSCWFRYHGLPSLKYSTGFFPCLHLYPVSPKVIVPRCPYITSWLLRCDCPLLMQCLHMQKCKLSVSNIWQNYFTSKGPFQPKAFYDSMKQTTFPFTMHNSCQHILPHTCAIQFFKHIGTDNLY